LDRKFGINAYDFTGRFYDITDDRFWSMDPMAEDYYDVSPYVYGLNNPLRFDDPTGMAPGDTINGGSLKEVNVTANFIDYGFALAFYSIANFGSQVNKVFGLQNSSLYNNFLAGFNFHMFALAPYALLQPKQSGTNTESLSKIDKNVNTSKINSGLSKTISLQKQARHILGTAKSGGSFLNSINDAQAVLDAVNSGRATFLGISKAGHMVYKFDGVTGTNVNLGVGITRQPTNVFIIKGTSSPSVVPTSPLWKPF
jgi:RHS repeat-associated protein